MTAGFTVFLALFVWALAVSIYLLVHRTPAIILNEQGVVDGITLWYSGLGLILWEEILGLATIGKGRPGSFLSQRRLVILVANPAAFRRRQGPFARLLLAIASLDTISPVAIPERLLPITCEELAQQITRYMSALHREEPV